MTRLSTLWKTCLNQLETEIPEQQLNTWLRPLHAVEHEGKLTLLAPNRFVLNQVESLFLRRIGEIIRTKGEFNHVVLGIGSHKRSPTNGGSTNGLEDNARLKVVNKLPHNLNSKLTFDTFIEGKSNQLSKAAAAQVADHPGEAYNPLFIYGGVGLGKTHLLHATGNRIRAKNPSAKVVYLHSERFVNDMVNAIRNNMTDEFKQRYRSVNALLVDDIQFLAGKGRSQEEFFHTFNTLVECKQQIILTCDRYPKEVDKLEERLKSRFGCGLTQAIDPPDLETRVAIIQSKALQRNIELPIDVAFFIGKRIRSNIRELEGALHRIIASAQYRNSDITIDFAKNTLHDLLASQDRLISIDNIQKTVAKYYNLRPSDLLSARRSRSIARPRQVAMSLTKELTNHSLPEIGDAFGGRDHTTVLHAHKRVKELCKENVQIRDDYTNLIRELSC